MICADRRDSLCVMGLSNLDGGPADAETEENTHRPGQVVPTSRAGNRTHWLLYVTVPPPRN